MSETFKNHSNRRKLTEEECRAIVNSVLIYLSLKDPRGFLKVPSAALLTTEMLAAGVEGLAVSITDDDAFIIVGSAARVMDNIERRMASEGQQS